MQGLPSSYCDWFLGCPAVERKNGFPRTLTSGERRANLQLRGHRPRTPHAAAGEHRVPEPFGAGAGLARARRGVAFAHLRDRRGAAVRNATVGAPARPARRAPRHGAGAGKSPRPDRGRLGRRPGRQRHERRRGGDDRACELGGGRPCPGARPRLSLLRSRGAACRRERPPPRLRRSATRGRIGPRRHARADRRRDSRRLSREPECDARLSRRKRPLGSPVAGRERDRARGRRARPSGRRCHRSRSRSVASPSWRC